MLKDSGVVQLSVGKTETRVYDLEEEIIVVPKTNPSMAIDRTLDYEAEELIKNLDVEL